MAYNPISRALVSVSDKTGIVAFCEQLAARNISILSTGGTAKLLKNNGISVTEVSDHTGFPEIMAGRVKTLHPAIHGGILGRREEDADVMTEMDIAPIDLVVVNLYPFQDVVSNPQCTLENAVENIDIGGPAMLRAAAKNHQDVTVLVDIDDYEKVLVEMQQNAGAVTTQTRFDLAVKCFEHTAQYDGAIASYFGSRLIYNENDNDQKSIYPRTINLQLHKKQDMRYGENPHQTAAFYTEPCDSASVGNSIQLQGKALSYNNVADTDAALECVRQFGIGHACVIVKHANPCGVAQRASQLEAYESAFATDAESAFGGIIAFNQSLQADTAAAIIEKQFVEVIIAPGVAEEAKPILASKSNVRVLDCGVIQSGSPFLQYKRVTGGLLVQQNDDALYDTLNVVSRRAPSDSEMEDLLFSWSVAKYVKSNAIIYARDKMTIGVGAGQMSRVNSSRIAAIKAKHAGLEVNGAVMASDAFFPFRDGLDNAAADGIAAVIQPGGSMRDDEVIAAADEHNIAMIFTGMRHFRH